MSSIPTQKPPPQSENLANISSENAEPKTELKTRRRKKRDERPKTIDFGCLGAREQLMQSLKR